MKTRRSIVTALILATAGAMPIFAQSAIAPIAPAPPAPAAPVAPAPAAPVAAAPVPAVPTSRVLVIPFVTLNLTPDQKWIGQAVQETLLADLGKSTTYSASPFAGQTIVEDNAAAIRLAKDAGVPYALRGSAQVVNGELRLTAQLLDAKTGDSVTTAIVTGPANHLLKLEDELAVQLNILPAPVKAATADAPSQPAPLAPAYATPQPAYTPAAPPVYTAQQPAYTPPPAYPPEPFNDIALSAQNYNAYPVYDSPVYSSPVYYYPAYSPIYYGYGGRSGYIHYPLSGGFGGRAGFHAGGSFNAGAGSSGFRSGGFNGGIHTGGGFSGGIHTGGGFSGGHGGRR